MLDNIKSGVVYEHEKHGDVLVTAVGEMYDMYTLTGGTEMNTNPDSKLVYYYNRFDGYGGMNPTPLTQNVHEFAKHADKSHPHERLGSDLLED